MEATLQDIILVASFCVAMSVFPLVLQYSLSIRKTKWFGWILPTLVFFVSLSATYASYVATIAEGASFGRVLLVFVLFNLLTVALVAIYRFCRTLEYRREVSAAKKQASAAVRAEKDKMRETIELK